MKKKKKGCIYLKILKTDKIVIVIGYISPKVNGLHLGRCFVPIEELENLKKVKLDFPIIDDYWRKCADLYDDYFHAWSSENYKKREYKIETRILTLEEIMTYKGTGSGVMGLRLMGADHIDRDVFEKFNEAVFSVCKNSKEFLHNYDKAIKNSKRCFVFEWRENVSKTLPVPEYIES